MVARIARRAVVLGLLIYGAVRWHDCSRREEDAAPLLAALGLHEVDAFFLHEELLTARGTPEEVAAALLTYATDAPGEGRETSLMTRGVSLPSQLRGHSGYMFLVCTTGTLGTAWGSVVLSSEGGRLCHVAVFRSSNPLDAQRGWHELPLPVSATDLVRRLRAGELAGPRSISVSLDPDQHGECSIEIGSDLDVERLDGTIVGGKLERLTSRK